MTALTKRGEPRIRGGPRGGTPHPGRLGWRGAAILALTLGALTAWIALRRHKDDITPEAEGAPSILAHIPPGAMLVAVIDMPALRATPMGEAILGQGRSVAGLGEVQQICGIDPMAAVEELAVAIPDAAEDAGFGLFATGKFDAAQLLGCAQKIVEQRGGRPVRVPSGTFTVLRDASLELSSAELAVADGGPLILAEPSYVRASIGISSAASLQADSAHAALRSMVPRGQITATVVLSAEQRRALLDELRVHGHTDSPLRGVLGGAVSLRISAIFDIEAALRCEDAASCRALGDRIREAARAEADTMTAQALGLAPVLERMRIEPAMDGSYVRVSISVPTEEALALIRRALALRNLADRDVPAPEPPPETDPAAPDAADAGSADAGSADAGIEDDAGVRIEAPRPRRPR